MELAPLSGTSFGHSQDKRLPPSEAPKKMALPDGFKVRWRADRCAVLRPPSPAAGSSRADPSQSRRNEKGVTAIRRNP